MELIEERRKILLNTPHIETISTSAFKTDMVAPFKKLEVRFEAEQSGSGDPSPDNVRPIEGRKELIVRHSGVNIWDEEWELGSLNNSTGEKVSSSSSIRSKNFIPVRPNTQYYFPNLDGYVLQYDQNKGYIGILADRNTKPTDATCYYLMFRLSTNYGTVYKNDYSINYPATVTEYEPYQGVDYKINWGKNLLNVENIFIDTRNYVVNEDKSITILQSNGNAWASNLVPSVSLNAGTYTFSRTNPVGATTIRSSADNYASDIVRLSAGDYSKTFTLTEDAIVKFKVNTGSTATYPNTTFVQIELGSKATEYQPYVGEVYGGTLDVVTGLLTVDRRYLTVSDFSLWGGDSVSAGGLHWVNVPKSYPTALAGNGNICSHAEYLDGGNGWLSSIPAYSTAGIFPARIYVQSNSMANFRAEYASLQAVYMLAEPQTYQLTPQQILTLKNNNTLMPEGTINEIKYWSH
jgi:hypothetical protein